MLMIRLKAIAAFSLFFIIGLIGFYFSVQSLTDYFNFSNIIIYSQTACFSLLFSFVIFLFSVYPGHVAFYGTPIPVEKSKIIYKMILVFFVMSLVMPVIFSFIYVNKIKSKGYIQCSGTPSGWTPMSATKYVTDRKLCLRPGE